MMVIASSMQPCSQVSAAQLHPSLVKLLAWKLEVNTGVADIRTCQTANNVSDHLNQGIGDGDDWRNVPSFRECRELNGHQDVPPRRATSDRSQRARV